jgi:hypothetical protein
LNLNCDLNKILKKKLNKDNKMNLLN